MKRFRNVLSFLNNGLSLSVYKVARVIRPSVALRLRLRGSTTASRVAQDDTLNVARSLKDSHKIITLCHPEREASAEVVQAKNFYAMQASSRRISTKGKETFFDTLKRF